MATLLETLHALAEVCGEYGSYTTTATGTTTTLICSAFANANLAASEMDDRAALIESGALLGQQRAVQRSGLARTTGTLTVAEAFTGAPASGVLFGVYARLPAFRRLNRPGYIEAINQALRRVYVEDEVAMDGVTDQSHAAVNTTTYPWWTDADRIIKILAPVTDSDDVPRALPRHQWDWRANGETRQLVFPGAPFQTGESFTVNLYRPANSRLKISGTWTDQTTQTAGLSTLTDEHMADVKDVVVVARAIAYRFMAEQQAPGQTVAEWMAKAEMWESRANRLLSRSLPKDRLTGQVELRPVVVGRRRGRG